MGGWRAWTDVFVGIIYMQREVESGRQDGMTMFHRFIFFFFVGFFCVFMSSFARMFMVLIEWNERLLGGKISFV